MAGKTQTYKCLSCGDAFTARSSDRKRGWAKFCSKSCKAITQTKKIGLPFLNEIFDHDHDLSWDAHKFGGF